MPLRVDRAGEKGAYVTIQGQDLSIRLVEKTVRTERDLTVKEQRERKEFAYTYVRDRYTYTPTGALKLGVACSTGDLRRAISDGKQQRIEEHLNRFVVGLEWRRAEEIRAYVSAVEAKALNDTTAGDSNGELDRWMSWARSKADSLDPLVEVE
ncbi:MAG: hypothetical protein E6H56_15625 [Betaproteobacteria bacterium]|nr:MAG: hypothetical protein E6H56_15625 [Betaproteobacteria bacterium]